MNLPQFKATILWLLLFLTSTVQAESSRHFFIKPGEQGDGSTWAKASGNLSATLRQTRSGDMIWVAAGTYYPSLTDDRRASFVIPDGVEIYGGFTGHETQLSARNPSKNLTVLSGNIGNPDSIEDNSYTVVRFHSVSPATILDGFHIRDGHADGQVETVNPISYGGGIFLEAASPTIRNCVIEQNQALYGGGLYVNAHHTTSALHLQNCTFADNYAELYGGGISNGSSQKNARLTMTNCRFIGNHALYGAGIANQVEGGSSVIQLQGCHFQKNFADLRGGAILNHPSAGGKGKIDFTACSFSGNTSTVGREADEAPYRLGNGTLEF